MPIIESKIIKQKFNSFVKYPRSNGNTWFVSLILSSLQVTLILILMKLRGKVHSKFRRTENSTDWEY